MRKRHARKGRKQERINDCSALSLHSKCLERAGGFTGATFPANSVERWETSAPICSKFSNTSSQAARQSRVPFSGSFEFVCPYLSRRRERPTCRTAVERLDATRIKLKPHGNLPSGKPRIQGSSRYDSSNRRMVRVFSCQVQWRSLANCGLLHSNISVRKITPEPSGIRPVSSARCFSLHVQSWRRAFRRRAMYPIVSAQMPPRA